MSPSGVALATLLHVLVALAFWWVSPLHRDDLTPDPIEITMEQEAPPPPPVPPTPPTPAHATACPGRRAATAAAPACAANATFADGLQRADRHDDGSARGAQGARYQCGQAGADDGGAVSAAAHARTAEGGGHRQPTKEIVKPEPVQEAPKAEPAKEEAKPEPPKEEQQQAALAPQPTAPAPPPPPPTLEKALPPMEPPPAPLTSREIPRPAPPPPPPPPPPKPTPQPQAAPHPQTQQLPPAARQQLPSSPLSRLPQQHTTGDPQQASRQAPSSSFTNPADVYGQRKAQEDYLWNVVRKIPRIATIRRARAKTMKRGSSWRWSPLPAMAGCSTSPSADRAVTRRSTARCSKSSARQRPTRRCPTMCWATVTHSSCRSTQAQRPVVGSRSRS